MLLANQCAAKMAKKYSIPFVYRIHEDPSPEKIQDMRTYLTSINIEYPHFTTIKPAIIVKANPHNSFKFLLFL